MFTDPLSAAELASQLESPLGSCSWADIAVFPPFTSIAAVSDVLRETAIKVGGQNLHWMAEGAFTGEISPQMLLKAGCDMVIIGHSERRTYFGETDATVLLKADAALSAGLRPIVCVGETLEQRESGITESVLTKQISAGLGRLINLDDLTIAYEPVWAIGTGKNATPEQASDAHKFIRSLVLKLWGDRTAESIRILYGGSVKPDNARPLWQKEDIDGFLVGGASLKAESFEAIAKSVR
jgi:triosephosphate isomerase